MKMDWWNRVDSWRFWLGTEIRFGPSIRNELARLAASAGKRIFLAGYASPSPLDSLYETLVEQLKKEGFDVQVFFRVTGEPASSLAIEGYELASRIAPEVILGVGGGSVLDTAKAIAYQIRTGISLDRVLGCKAGRNSPPADLEVDSDPPGMPVRLILMPTTPGSGSEVSEVAVLGGEFSSGDVPGPIPVKWVLSSSRLRADVAILDPEVVKTCPDDLLYQCAIDALSHAVESAYSRAANPMSFMCSAQTLRILYHVIPRLEERTIDLGLCGGMALAGMLGGMALNTAGAGIAHALAHGLGAVLGLPHAEAIAVALPQAIRFNRKEAQNQLTTLAEAAGICQSLNEQEAAAKLEEWIWTVTERIGRPARNRYHLSSLDENTRYLVARSAEASSILPLRLNPRRVRFEDLLQLSSAIVSEGETSPGSGVG